MARDDLLVAVDHQLNSAAVVRPGDTLVIGLDTSGREDDDLKRLKAQLGEELPGVKVVVIDGARSMGGYRPDDSALTAATRALSEIRDVTGTSTEAHHIARAALDEIGRLRPSASHPPEAQVSAKGSLFTWDYRQQPPMRSIAAKVRELSGGEVVITEIDTQSDEYMIAIADREVSADEALAEYVRPLDRE